MKYNHNDAKDLVSSYYEKIKGLSRLPKEVRPRIHKHLLALAEIASCTLLVKSLENANLFVDIFDCLKFWSGIMSTLMESDFDFFMNIVRLSDMIYKFVDIIPTARHLYMLCDVLYEEVS